MSTCQRFDSEGLARFVAGEPLDAHFDTCPDCLAARAGYQAVIRTLEQARNAYSPPANWEAKVWARIATASADAVPWYRRASLRWATGLVAAGALALFVMQSSGGPQALELTAITLERGSGQVVRGVAAGGEDVRSAAPGSIVRLVVAVPRGKVGDLRVYRGKDELVFQCATSPACVRSRDGLEARVTLDKVGTYRTVIIAAEKALPPATGDLDTDYAAAMRAGEAKQSTPIEVL